LPQFSICRISCWPSSEKSFFACASVDQRAQRVIAGGIFNGITQLDQGIQVQRVQFVRALNGDLYHSVALFDGQVAIGHVVELGMNHNGYYAVRVRLVQKPETVAGVQLAMSAWCGSAHKANCFQER
jgi:hypothetical protein